MRAPAELRTWRKTAWRKGRRQGRVMPPPRNFLPNQLRDRRSRREIRGFQELPERGGVERRALRAAMQLLAMDAGCHKETIKALVVRAFDIGSHRVANHEDPRAIDDFGALPP